jgi:hypothetical protein
MTKVWESKLDNKYDCYVTRTSDYDGELRLEDEGKLLFKTDVILSYGAKFGPDVADIQLWCNMCILFVDNIK